MLSSEVRRGCMVKDRGKEGRASFNEHVCHSEESDQGKFNNLHPNGSAYPHNEEDAQAVRQT